MQRYTYTTVILKSTIRKPTLPRPHFYLLRCQLSHTPPIRAQNNISSFYEQNFLTPTRTAFQTVMRIAKFSFVTLVLTAVAACTAYEGLHMWIENAELAADNDDELKKWGWLLEAERWSGGTNGGTDPALGFKARHAIRSAWIAQHWGLGSGIVSSNATITGAKQNKVVDASLEYAYDFLHVAILSAQEILQSGSSKLHPGTLIELLTREASILEKIGTRDALLDSQIEYGEIWKILNGVGPEAARIASKLGDLCSRLGEGEQALRWWFQSIKCMNDEVDIFHTPIALVEARHFPVSAYTQRTMASLITSLSAHYARTSQFEDARLIESHYASQLKDLANLPLITDTQISEISEKSTSEVGTLGRNRTVTAPELLHQLFMLHRSSVLFIHLSEVLHALKFHPNSSIEALHNAAEASENVALRLCDLPSNYPDIFASNPSHPSASEAVLHTAFSKSRVLREPATNLLRAAKRSAAEAWSLRGLLAEVTEGKGGIYSLKKALNCYERALYWVCSTTDGVKEAGDAISQADWDVLWSNYVRVSELVRQDVKK